VKAVTRQANHRSKPRRRWEGGSAVEGGGKIDVETGHDMTAVRMRRSHEDWEGAGKAMGRRWEGV
jgi:hypothetical protein